MTIMAPKSSITAKAVKNIFKEAGTLFPNKDKIPIAKAISVAIGIPAPFWVIVPKFSAKKIPAGTTIPPNAPKIGSAAFLMLANSPSYISRSNSKPIIKKKIAIKPSFIQSVIV